MQTGSRNSRTTGFYSEWDGGHQSVLSRVKRSDLRLTFYNRIPLAAVPRKDCRVLRMEARRRAGGLQRESGQQDDGGWVPEV